MCVIAFCVSQRRQTTETPRDRKRTDRFYYLSKRTSLEDLQQLRLSPNPRELPESKLLIMQQFPESSSQAPWMRSLSEYSLQEHSSDPFRDVTRLRGGGEEVEEIKHEEEGVGVGESKLVDNGVDEVMLT